MIRIARDCRDREPSIKLVSPHASWERLGAGILGTRDWCYERPDVTHYEARAWTAFRPIAGLGSARVKEMPHYDALVREAQRAGWPRSFERDLYVHDKAHCDRLDPSEPFVWALRESGTHLYSVSTCPGKWNGHEGFECAPAGIVRAFGDAVRFYTWDGRALRAHRDAETCAEAARVLGERWRREREARKAS